MLIKQFRVLFLLVADSIKDEGKSYSQGRGKRTLTQAVIEAENLAFRARVDQLVDYAEYLGML